MKCLLKTEYPGAELPLRTTLKRKLRLLDRIAMHPVFDWLNTGREEVLEFRRRARREFGLKAIILLTRFELENYKRVAKRTIYLRGEEPLPIRGFTRTEKIGGLSFLALVGACATVPGNTSSISAMAVTSAVAQSDLSTEPKGPINWLDGESELNGYRKDALSGPLKYARASGYEFAANKDRLLEMVEEGTLVKLEETKSLKFNKVSRPYALPVVAKVIYRLADQYYYDQKCGPLWLNGAARDIAFQQTLDNGSDESVHPAGMAFDLKSTGLTLGCQIWLEKTLLDIEATRRIDFTKEVSEKSPHFHVSVATHEYEAWLEKRLEVTDSETDWLRKALFFEGGPKETAEGFRAIAWAIRNRVRSKDYPNTIQGVVADGSQSKHNGGCQFSFMCDGKPEDRYEKCRTGTGKLTNYWRFKCDMRWEKVTVIAKAVMAETKDPTGGATLYYATWMNPKPHWARSRTEKRADGKIVDLPYGDFSHKPVEIGNHYFGRSNFAGKDVWEGDAS